MHPAPLEADVGEPVLLADTVTASACENCGAPLPGDALACPQCGRMTSRPEAPEMVQRLSRALGSQFRVSRLVGRGGFAEVYEVQDTELRRTLAVKVLRTDIDWGPDTAARFKHEARAIAQLSHPHTVPIHYVGEAEGLVFYVMPFIEGLTLTDILRANGPLEPAQAAAVAIPILDALEHAHRLGIVHRDIKPDNIIVDGASGRPLLVDFGISTMRGSDGGAEPGLLGTPAYMSPEQALGERDVDGRADLYAMAAVLAQMVTGHPPFEGSSSREILAKQVADPPSLPDDEQRLPAWLRVVIVRGLQKRREDRYPDAGAMLADVRQGLPATARTLMTGTLAIPGVSRDDPTVRLSSVTRTGRHSRRRRVLGLGAVVAVSAAALSWWLWTIVGVVPPRLLLRNGLLAPVQVSVNGGAERSVPPGDSVRMDLPRGTPLDARWRVSGPVGADGDLRGESLGGTIAAPAPKGEVRRDITPAATQGYAMPRLWNATKDTMVVTLRDSAGRVLPCNCRAAPGGSLALGYRRMNRLRSVEVTDRTGRTLVFESLNARMNPATGEIALPVRPADFVPPTALVPPDAAADTATRFVAPLPGLRFETPQPIPDTIATRPDTTDSTARKHRARDPLAPIFKNR